MRKEKLQNKELNQVSGGATQGTVCAAPEIIPCPKCGAQYDKYSTYPDGFFVDLQVKNGCSGTNSYKCPACGYTWTVDV